VTDKETEVKVKFRQLKSGTTVTTTYKEKGEDVDKDETLKKAHELHEDAKKIGSRETMKDQLD